MQEGGLTITAWNKKSEELASFLALTQIFCRTSNNLSEAVELDGQWREWPELSMHKLCEGKKS